MSGENDYTPGYTKIQNYIREQIQNGTYTIGSKIPSESELAQMFSVSRVTANKALKEMAVLGILERVRGQGSFIASTSPINTQSRAFASASLSMDINSRRRHHLVQFRTVGAYPEIAELANIPVGESVYELILENKSHDGSDEISSIDFIYIPASIVSEDITSSLAFFQDHFVFEYFEKRLNISPRFMKVYTNIPQYSFLGQAEDYFGHSESLLIWDTEIYDYQMKLLGVSYTVSPDHSKRLPLFTFRLQ